MKYIKNYFLIVVFLFICLFSFDASAKRTIMTLNELIESSEIIAYAHLVSINWEDIQNCSWVFKLDHIYKTNNSIVDTKTVRIVAKGIRQEEDVFPSGIASYVLFLKKTNGYSNYSLEMERFWKIKRVLTSNNSFLDIIENDLPATEIPNELYSELDLKPDLSFYKNDNIKKTKVIEFLKLDDWLWKNVKNKPPTKQFNGR